MTDGDEISKALCRTFAEIAGREKKRAIQNDDYAAALVASVFEGLFKDAAESVR